FFLFTGVDLSIKMMERAKDKGIENLVIGDARKLPFLDKTFDTSTSVHVFHLVNDRRQMMLEAARVSRKFIMSLVNETNRERQEGNSRRSMVWEIYLETREEYGYPLEPSKRS
ncbi:Methyltransferase type 11 domain protein, partial [mine drainage metagenome]